MLPVETQQRLMDSIPDRINASYSTSSGLKSADLVLRDGDPQTPDHLFWGYVDAEPNYPVVVLELNPAGVLWDQGRSLDTLMQTEVADDSAGTLRELHGEPMYDELMVTFAMEQNDVTESAIESSDRLSARKLAKTVASELYAHFLALDLNSAGDGDFEWPVRLEPMAGPSNVTRTAYGESTQTEPDVERWQFTFRVYYTMTWQVIVDSANRLDIDISLDVDGDGEVDTTRSVTTDLSSD